MNNSEQQNSQNQDDRRIVLRKGILVSEESRLKNIKSRHGGKARDMSDEESK